MILSEHSFLFTPPLLAVTVTPSATWLYLTAWNLSCRGCPLWQTHLGLHSIEFCAGCPGPADSATFPRLPCHLPEEQSDPREVRDLPKVT